MNLRKIEISGFKSFMSPLELDFSKGITAILGPNGCGKSNVVDSIRWVLGEQRSRLLRNTKMENVLFNGTRLRKSLGMAEVYLTLINDDHKLNVDYEEVTIGRRLYRSGVSDYLINGQPCRLKDLKGLLVDTGLGNSAYSIIERDMIEKVLSEKEQDKRNLLEEAAGVMRYRIQREEAERKIKATEQDLLRLADILSELEKELRSLKYQMGKARRYTRLKEEADQLETIMLKSSLYELLERKKKLEGERTEHESIQLADDNEIAIHENRLQEMKVETAEFETHLQERNEHRYDLSTRLQQHEERIAVHNERIAASNARILEDDGEIAGGREKLEGLGGELAECRRVAEEKRGELATASASVSSGEAALADVTSRLEHVRDTLRSRKQLALDLVRERARERGAIEHIENSLGGLAEKQDLIESQLDDLSTEESHRVSELSGIEERVSKQQLVLADLQNNLTMLSENLDRVGEDTAACDTAHAAAHREHATLVEKREFLDRIRQEHTRWSDETLGRFDGLEGVLADFVRVDRRYRKCFEACLTPILKSVVAATREDAVSCVREFRDGDAGRVQILFADNFTAAGNLPTGDGVIAPAADLIECDNQVVDYVRAYLNGVVVVEDVETAVRLLGDGVQRVATLDGVFFDGPGRIIVAGSGDIEMTMLEYDTKLAELSGALERAQAEENKQKQRREELVRERDDIQKKIGDIRVALTSEEEHYDELVASRREAELHLVRVKEKITGLGDAIAETRTEIASLRTRLEATRMAEEGVGSDDLDDADLSELEARAVALERDKDAATEAVATVRLQNVALAGEVETLDTRIRNLEKLDLELKALIQARTEDATRCREQIRLSEEDVERLRAAIAELHAEKDVVEKDIEETSDRYRTLKESCDNLEKQARAIKDQRDVKRANIERVSVEMATVEERISSVVEKAAENFGQDLAPFVEDPARFDPAEWESFDRATLDDVKHRLESIGPVNMLAMEEHDEKKERFDFLSQQKQDLEEAKDSLTQAIRRINREARRLLNETFEQVRQNFRETFLTLFDGGEADLMFVDSDDPLEANIKIVASPRGKKLHDISSLSSGERALVALSLLFAIYLVKPSPFCVFDEVDAPLDDANIARFVRLLKSFTDRTQFIVITHNKKTMEAADNLYGVTMEEPGVSKLISIHLDEAERFKHHAPAPAAAAEAAPA